MEFFHNGLFDVGEKVCRREKNSIKFRDAWWCSKMQEASELQDKRKKLKKCAGNNWNKKSNK